MNTKKKAVLYILVIIAVTLIAIPLLREFLHDPPEQETLDSLEYIKDQARQNADLNRDSSQSEKQKSDEAKKLYNSPADSSVWEQLWTTIERKAKEDSSRKRATR